eukprot:381626_1
MSSHYLKQLVNQYESSNVGITQVLNIQDTLNHFLHLMDNHNSNHDFEYVYTMLGGSCCILNCNKFKRNYRQRNDNKTLYPTGNKLYCQIMDKIHCFYRHSFDIGYRLRSKHEVLLNRAKEESIGYKTKVINTKWFRHQFVSMNKHQQIQQYLSNRLNNRYNELSIALSANKEEKNDDFSFKVYHSGAHFNYDKIQPKYQSLKLELTNNDIYIVSV